MFGRWIQQRLPLGVLGGIVALLCILCTPATATLQAASSGDWPTYLHDNAHSGFNAAETVINKSTAANLKLKWTHTTGGGIFAQPTVSNGVIYWGSFDGYEHATDLNNNKVWALNLGTTVDSNCNPVAVGVASTATIANVTINGVSTAVDFVGGGSANFYAINAATRAVIWSKQLGSSPDHFVWSSPAVYNGSVYIGMASFGDCPLVQGQLIQMNAATGAIQNTFNVVPNGCTGGGVWGAPTVDEANNTVYFATGNAGSCSVNETYALSLVEVSATNLAFIHHWQVPANQQLFDTDFGNTPTLFTATINGTLTQMVGVANKNGFYYAFNRANIFNGPVWEDQIARGGSCPQCGDGSISPSAWDGSTLYVAGGNTTINGVSCQGSLRAVNPANGNFIWQHCMLAGPVLGAVTAVPGVVVVSEGTYVLAIDAATSATLFRFQDTNSGSMFWGPASISNGVMYVGNMDGHLYAFAP